VYALVNVSQPFDNGSRPIVARKRFLASGANRLRQGQLPGSRESPHRGAALACSSLM
jgi:hypothetical protein